MPDQAGSSRRGAVGQLGRAIPADVAVVGFDNWEPVGAARVLQIVLQINMINV